LSAGRMMPLAVGCSSVAPMVVILVLPNGFLVVIFCQMKEQGCVQLAISTIQKGVHVHTQSEGWVQIEEPLIQNSFAIEDAMALLQFRETVDKQMEGWHFCDLLPIFLDKWGEQLDMARAVLVVFSDSYRVEIAHPGSPLRSEALRIKDRLARDSHFMVFVLDPNQPGQTANDLRALLIDGALEMNRQGWLQELARHGL